MTILPQRARRSAAIVGCAIAVCGAWQLQGSADEKQPSAAAISEAFNMRGNSLADTFLQATGYKTKLAHGKEAIGTFLAAHELYSAGEYGKCRDALGAFWKKYPQGADAWGNDDWPVGYVPLHVLTECANARTAADWNREKPKPLRMTVVLVGKTISNNRTCLIDPGLLNVDGKRRIVRAQALFGEYVKGITRGRLKLEQRIISLPDLATPYSKPDANGERSVLYEAVEDAVGDNIKTTTDVWWIIRPNHPGLKLFAGMTGTQGSPHFISDDLWELHPQHAPQRLYTDAEYDLFFTVWLQHEFWHYLYALYPEFQLEREDHQWWYRDKWPHDFQGRFEADYYAESLHKRFQPHGRPPLHEKLVRPAPPVAAEIPSPQPRAKTGN